MIARPDLIMIGATGRNAGKTEFACALIKRCAPLGPVTAVKITAIREAGSSCARGGTGCGVCTSLEGRFTITEEGDATLPKDTSRMLAAGAHRVLWLRARREHLEEAVEALLAQIPEGGAVICESTSARHAIDPGLFLLLRPQGEHPVKPSAAGLMPLADRVVTCTGTGWDLAPDQCRLHQGAWTSFDTSAVILAGGQSRRMGQDKSLMPVGGQPLIAGIAAQLAPRFPEVLISSNEPWKYRFLGLPVIADEEPGQGPLMGLLSSLKAAAGRRILAIACDIPVLDLAFIDELLLLSEHADIVMPVSASGRREPLFAVYDKRVIPQAQALLAAGRRRIVDVLEGLTVSSPAMPEGWYHNLNTPQDCAAYWQTRPARPAS